MVQNLDKTIKDLISWLLIHQINCSASSCQLSIYCLLDSKVLSLWMPTHPFPNHFFLSKLLRNFEYLATKGVKIRRKGKEEIDDPKKKMDRLIQSIQKRHLNGLFLFLPSNPSSSPPLQQTFIKYFHHGDTVYR